MNKPSRINVLNLIRELDILLIRFLRSLTADEWNSKTLAKEWRVKDIAAHLLDGNLRTISILRDGYFGDPPKKINSYHDTVRYLNRLNNDWVTSTKRLSPKVLIDLLESSGEQYFQTLSDLNPEEQSIFSVAWAGEEVSKNWFHIAREYTEKWHHQQQIRLACGDPNSLLVQKYFIPYLDTSVRALPHFYRNTQGSQGDIIKISFVGDYDESWFLKYSNGWELLVSLDTLPNARLEIPHSVAWKLFTKGITGDEAKKNSVYFGDHALIEAFFETVAVMA